MNAAEVWIADTSIFVRCGYNLRAVATTIPGHRWIEELKAWRFPLNPWIARRIHESFVHIKYDATFKQLISDTAERLDPEVPPVLGDTGIPAIPIEKSASWKHQRAGFWRVVELWKSGHPGAMLAMIMGTGKSKLSVDLVVNQGLSPVLILCPLRVVEVWRTQFERHAAKPVRFVALDERAGSVAEKTRLARDQLALARERNEPIAIAINYESSYLNPFSSWAMATFWDLIIADESHRLKQASGKISRFAGRLALRSRHRLCLTGTPMPHSPLDVWAQYRFLDRRIYDPSYHSFKLRYTITGGFENRNVVGYRDLDDLKERFYSIAYRVTSEVLDLPGEMHESLYTHLGAEGQRIYGELQQHFLADLEGGTITAANALVRLLRFQQLTGGTLKDDDGREHRVDRNKEHLLKDLLEDFPEQEPVVIFCRFHSDLDAVSRAAGELKRGALELSGRRDQLKEWLEDKSNDKPILAVQIQAGGVGIDLTRSRYGIYYSLGFSLGDYLQSLARIHRPGQTRPVAYYHLLIRGTVDEIIMRALAARQNVVDSVLEELRCKPMKLKTGT